MAAVQSFIVGGSGVWRDAPPGIFLVVLRCILVYSEAYTEKHTELLEKRLIIIIIIATGTLETVSIG